MSINRDIASSVKTFPFKYNVPVLDHLSYLPDPALWDFYVLPKIKSALKSTKFQIFEAVKEKTARVMKEFTEDFKQWKIRIKR